MDSDSGRVASQPGSQGSAPQPATPSSPVGADPSRNESRKGYLLGKLDERKDITRFLAIRSARALINGYNLPWWAFVRRFQCRWTAVSCSLAASEIEHGDHATDQAVWLVNIDNGIIVGRDAFRRDSDEHPKDENAKRLSGEAVPARAEGIAQPSPDTKESE